LGETTNFGEYTVNIYREEGGCFFTPSSLEILKNGCRVYGIHGCDFWVHGNKQTDNATFPCGADITGDGQPNLVIHEWTGGAHGGHIFHLFETGQQFRFIQSINTEHGSPITRFENLDDDPALEFCLPDWTFAYWRTSFAESPAPEIILKYRQEKYLIAPELMRKPGLTQDALKKLVKRIQALPEWEQGGPPVELWAQMLDLIYTGNMTQALELTSLCWPEAVAGKDVFLSDFLTELKNGPFWTDIEKMNASCIPAQ
jgi:hypothetical protein